MDRVSSAPKLRPNKNGFFQKLAFTGTWLADGEDNAVGITELDTNVAVAFPWPSREQPIIVAPGFGVSFYEPAVAFDMPSTVYGAYLQGMWLPRWNERWSGILAVAPGIYSDFGDVDAEAFRITGRALVRWKFVPDTWELLFGIVYLDRTNLSLLPAAGLIWTPLDTVRVDVVFPRPTVAWKFAQDPGVFEDWLYLGAELGGGAWLVDHDGQRERMTQNDIRLLLGLERKKDGGAGRRLEIGYVLDRSFEFERSNTEYWVDNTFLVRLNAAF